MPEILLGLLVGVVFCAQYALGGTALALVSGSTALVFYLASCYFWPFRRCWWCKGTKELGDGRGNLRPRNCHVCHRTQRVRRLGAMALRRDR